MKNKWVQLLQNCTFVQLFYLWVLLGIGFGSAYYLLSLIPQNALLYFNRPLDHGLFNFLNMVYFSFITLTSTGYGDIVPLGLSKILSIIEIFCGLIVFGFLISKMVSTRQEEIIEQLYDVSLEEKVSKIRTALYIYRTNISRLIQRIEATRRVKPLDIVELEANLEGLRTNITRVSKFLISESKNPVTRVNDLTLNLLFNSIHLSLAKIIEIIKQLNTKKYDWKQKTIARHISSCIDSAKEVQEIYQKKPLKDEIRTLLQTIENSLRELKTLMG